MSTFYGTLDGERKGKNKQGARRLNAHVRSWDHGIEVNYRLEDDGTAYCEVWQTGGSNNPKRIKLIKKYALGQVSKRRPGYDYIGGVGNQVRA